MPPRTTGPALVALLGWYRTPFKTAPKTVAVDWLAFYQTARFGDEKWAINFVAPVRGHELTTRAELLRTQPGHPRAGEQYFKIQLGPLERLPGPIPSRKWRRITFLYTTGERLPAAEELNDLIVQSAERERLWKALRERGLAAEHGYAAARRGEMGFALWGTFGNRGITPGETPRQGQRVEAAGAPHLPGSCGDWATARSRAAPGRAGDVRAKRFGVIWLR